MIAAVDGCKKGWVVTTTSGWPCSTPPRVRVVPDFRTVLEVTSACAVVVVDMPIGLASGRPSDSGFRSCDQAARQALGAGGSSRVFNAPPRGTLSATDVREFQARHLELTGVGAGLPVWGIVEKLKEVDDAMTPGMQERVREFHPELAWRQLAGRVLDSKHSALGLLQRLGAMTDVLPCLAPINLWPDAHVMKDMALDDLLDSLAGLPVAEAIRVGQVANRIPEDVPAVDAKGLRMEMWF